MYNIQISGFGELTAGSAAVKVFQRALKKAGFSPKGVDGTFGKNTRTAMQKFQKARGMEVHNWPTVPVLEALAIPPASWADIARDSGAPSMVIKSVAARAASAAEVVTVEEEAPIVLPLPGRPAAPEVVVGKRPVPAAAVGVGAWFKRNLKWIAVGTGLGTAVLIVAVVLVRRGQAEEI